MKTYIGSKIIRAKPMTLKEFNKTFYKVIPAKDRYGEDGYCVEYPDGYKGWSPKSVFETAYREITEEEKQYVA